MIMTKIKESEWSVNYLDIQNLEYKQLKCELCSCLEWRGENRAYVCFEKIHLNSKEIMWCITLRFQCVK